MTKLKQALDEMCDCGYPTSIDDIRGDCGNMIVEFQDGSETALREMLELLDNPPTHLIQPMTSAVR
jgi:hypothetical protein